MKLLLVSSSRVAGTGYLDHCEAEVRAHFADGGRLLFVPYALANRGEYARVARDRFAAMGLEIDSIHEAHDPLAAVEAAAGIFIGGGNTFRLLKTIQDGGLVEPLRRRVRDGMPYMGTSAGTNLAGPTIRTTNDMPIVEPDSFEALAFVDFQINPHYLDADPNSTHQGETREQRLTEFHEENLTPVVAIREGAMIVVRDGSRYLVGEPGGRLFRQGRPTLELGDGADLDAMLA